MSTAALGVLAVATVSCVGPARTESDYRLKARGTAKSAQSVVATAELTTRVVRDHSGFANYVAELLTEAERDVDNEQSTFASIQPPDRRSDDLRDQLGPVLNDTVDTISQMRIDARRHDWRALVQTADALPALSARLEPFSNLPK